MKECIVINDYSAFGSNSLAAALPVLATFGVKAHAFPTAVLSAHTGFADYAATTLSLPPFFAQASRILTAPDALLSGYISEPRQAQEINAYLSACPTPLYVLDPVLGDGGALYQGFTAENGKAILPLLSHASVITPNLTEACLLTRSDYSFFIEECNRSGARAALPLAKSLQKLGAKNVIITGILHGEEIETLLACGNEVYCFTQPAIAQPRSGTGDLFAALVTAFLLCGQTLPSATERAAHFVAKALNCTESKDDRLGTDFEKILPELAAFSPYAK